jgi:hypothetical protein
MSRRAVDNARPWFVQAASDARTAEALCGAPTPMVEGDVGCHVAAMCAQTVEKSLKGYVLLNGSVPAMDHRPDGYLDAFLRGDRLLNYRDHRGKLSKLFDAQTKAVVTRLLDLTPGGLGAQTGVANTEYPWTDAGRWIFAPAAAPEFAHSATIKIWLDTAKRVSSTLHKLWIAVDRATAI